MSALADRLRKAIRVPARSLGSEELCRALDRDYLSRLDGEFMRFHNNNPHVYMMLLELVREAKNKGRSKIGVGMLYERMRWELYIRSTGDEYKLNNNHRSRYARLLMYREPTLLHMFNVRELKS